MFSNRLDSIDPIDPFVLVVESSYRKSIRDSLRENTSSIHRTVCVSSRIVSREVS